MKPGILLIFILSFIYFLYCRQHVQREYKKYLQKTFIIPGLIALALIFFAGTFGHMNFVPVAIIFGLAFYGLNTLFYFLSSKSNKNEAPKSQPADIQSEKEEPKNQREEKPAIETEDMSKIKTLMGEITQKKKQLNVFNTEIGQKISSLEMMADTAIAEAYGEVAVGYKRGRYLESYNEIRSRYSGTVDNVVALQCDHIVQKINNSIEGRRRVIESNSEDKLKYDALYAALKNQYNKEYKIERMKAINAKVNELTDSAAELEASLNGGFVLEKAVEEFNRLNLEIETRRDLELKYTADNI